MDVSKTKQERTKIYEVWEQSRDGLEIFWNLRYLTMFIIAYSFISSSRRIPKYSINGIKSSGAAVTIGVPQGSNFGHIVFNVHNDVSNCVIYYVSNKHGIILLANDTSLLFKVKKHIDRSNAVNCFN